MALLFMDGFDHYPIEQLARKWNSVLIGTSGTVSIATGRYSGNALRCVSGSSSTAPAYVRKGVSNIATIIVGFAVKVVTTPAASSYLLHFVDETTTQIELILLTDFRLLLRRAPSTNLATSVATLTLNRWHYIEIKLTIDNSTGAYEVRKDGIAIIGPTTGVDTQNTSNASLNSVNLGAVSLSIADFITIDYDDFYICDTTGSVNNDFLGDVKIETLYPSGNGTSSDFTGSDTDSTDNYLLVDESSGNDDTDYVTSATVGHTDLYTIQDLSIPPSEIFGVQTNILARKDNAGIKLITPILRSGGTNYDGTNFGLTGSYGYFVRVDDVDPDTSVAWTESGINNLEAGFKVVV